LAEVRSFGLGSRFLSDAHDTSIGGDLARAGLSLGALKVFGFLGHQVSMRWSGLASAGAPAYLARLSGAVIPQAAMFAGMLASHQLEVRWGLRPQLDGATTVTDTL